MPHIALIFALLTGILWGIFGPLVAESEKAGGSASKPYFYIAAVYMFAGIAGGLLPMIWYKEPFAFTGRGTFFGLMAGVAGAGGALCLTLSMFKGGALTQGVVIAIVYATAIVVTAVVSIIQHWGEVTVSPRHFLAIAATVVCIYMVGYTAPNVSPAKPHPVVAEQR